MVCHPISRNFNNAFLSLADWHQILAPSVGSPGKWSCERSGEKFDITGAWVPDSHGHNESVCGLGYLAMGPWRCVWRPCSRTEMSMFVREMD